MLNYFKGSLIVTIVGVILAYLWGEHSHPGSGFLCLFIVAFLSILENMMVDATKDKARVVINERTGTIVIGSEVKLLPAAVAHGNITVTVQTTNQVSQPEPFSGGSTTAFGNSAISVNKGSGSLVTVPANSTLNDLVRALNAIGVAPIDLISIMQALREAGSLQAEIEVI